MKNKIEQTIEFQEAKFLEYKRIVTRYSKEVEKMKIAYNSFISEVGIDHPFAKETLNGIITNGQAYLENIIDRNIETIAKPLRNQFLEHWYLMLENLKREIREIQNWSHLASNFPAGLAGIESLEWIGDKLNISDEYFESVRTHFEIKISSEKEIIFWQKIIELEKAYNSFAEYIRTPEFSKEINIYSYLNPDQLFGIFGQANVPSVKAQAARLFPFRKNA